jgi:hypothetical protein
MKNILLAGAAVVLVAVIAVIVWQLWDFGPPFSFYHRQENVKIMKLTSPNFENNGMIPLKFTCDGEDVNPALMIGEVPPEAASLALVVIDPDAPMGSWTHWTIWNIDPATSRIAENSVPAGAVEGRTSFGSSGYGGPCPPAGTHHYIFRIYALDAGLDLGSEADNDDLEAAMAGHVIAKAELAGKYQRQ